MPWILGLVALALVATAVFVVMLRAATRAVARCREWKPATGRVIDISIRSLPTSSRTGPRYLPVVVYRYVVDGTEYTSERLAVVDVHYSLRRNAERRLAPYETGRAVQILIDPNAPANSVLECRAPTIPILWTLFVFTWVMVIVGITLLLVPGVDGPEPMIRL